MNTKQFTDKVRALVSDVFSEESREFNEEIEKDCQDQPRPNSMPEKLQQQVKK